MRPDEALYAEALAAFGAASSEHQAAATSRHASAESVRALAMQIAGLICALHDASSSCVPRMRPLTRQRLEGEKQTLCAWILPAFRQQFERAARVRTASFGVKAKSDGCVRFALGFFPDELWITTRSSV